MNKQPDATADFVGGIFKAMLDRYFLHGCAVGIGEEYLAGRMISQPIVTDAEGKPALLDEYLGDGLAILGFNCDPEQELGEKLAAQWQGRGVAMLGLGVNGSSQQFSLEAGSHLEELFSQGQANLVLLRPDRFCLAAFNSGNAADKLQQAAALLGLDSVQDEGGV